MQVFLSRLFREKAGQKTRPKSGENPGRRKLGIWIGDLMMDQVRTSSLLGRGKLGPNLVQVFTDHVLSVLTDPLLAGADAP